MMEAAGAWLKLNPDPADPFVRLPSLVATRARGQAMAERVSEKEWARYQRALKDPNLSQEGRDKLQAQLIHLREACNQIDATVEQVLEAERAVQAAVNRAPVLEHQKYKSSDISEAALGRWILSWARQGYNVFDLGPDFVAAMLLTDPKEIEFEELKLPFDGLLITIPDGFVVGSEGLSYTKIHICDLPANDVNQLGVAEKIHGVLDELSPGDAQRVLELSQVELAKMNRDLHAKHDNSGPVAAVFAGGQYDLVSSRAVQIHATDGTHVIDSTVRAHALTWKTFEALPYGSEVIAEQDEAARRAIGQIVFGTLAYLVAVRDAAVLRTEPPRKKKRTTNETKPKYWEVGRTIKIGVELVRAVRGGAREVAFRLKHKHIVIGHYRNQAYGAGRSERKRMWIAPHWKGPEDGAALVHTYKPEASVQ